MIRIDPDSALKSDIGIRGDIALECCALICGQMRDDLEHSLRQESFDLLNHELPGAGRGTE